MAVYQEKDKSKWTKDGRSWYYKFSYKDDDYYKKHKRNPEKKSKLFKTKKEALEEEAKEKVRLDNEYKNKKKKNKKKSPDKVSFKSVYEKWLKEKEMEVVETSIYNIEKTMDKNLLSKFKDSTLDEITYESMMNWKQEIYNSKKLTLTHQNKILGYTREILRLISNYYEFDKEIIRALKNYKILPSEKKKSNAEWNFWTYEEFCNFIQVVNNSYYNLLFNFLYYTGVRIGELVALTWEDIDLKRKTLKIRHNFSSNVKGKKFVIKDPKNENSIREIDLPDNLVALLTIHYKKESNLFGFNNKLFLFGNYKHLAETTLRRKLKEYISKTENKIITLHGFRHSHVSLLIYLGCDSREVAARIGDTVAEVEKTYYHMFPQKKNHTINVLNKLSENYDVITTYTTSEHKKTLKNQRL